MNRNLICLINLLRILMKKFPNSFIQKKKIYYKQKDKIEKNSKKR